MDSYSTKSPKRLAVLLMFFMLFLAGGLIKTSYAATIISSSPNATKNVELAYFQVFSVYPYQQYYLAPRYIDAPARVYYSRPGACCQKRCVANRCGHIVRCVKNCY